METYTTSPTSGLKAPHGKASLLVVDDDPLLVDFYVTALEIFDYQVSAALDGHQALDLYRQALEGGRAYDLVLLDANMPAMSGRECLDRLLCLDSQARILVCSGTPECDLGSWVTKAVGVIGKPIGLTDLRREIVRSLHSILRPHKKNHGHHSRLSG